MNSEINRLHSFTNWPRNLSVSINQLAKLGFYSTQKFLEIQCHFCSIKISNLSDQANVSTIPCSNYNIINIKLKSKYNH